MALVQAVQAMTADAKLSACGVEVCDEDDMFTVPDERIREVLDVLTGWSGNARRLSAVERNKVATDMLNALLLTQPYVGGDTAPAPTSQRVGHEAESQAVESYEAALATECNCGAVNDADCLCKMPPTKDER